MAAETQRVVVATSNPGKLAEIRSALALPGWEFVTPADLDADAPEVEESGDSFSENAFLKASAYHALFGLPALADDSGLVVDALGGRPGVRSSRYAGEKAADADNNRKLLEELDGFGPEMRAARFQCVVALIDGNGETTTACGTCEGQIGFTPKGRGGFGYDPLFLPGETPGRTMAELELAEKNAISHRGKALRALKDRLATSE
jgi:XTP/dITP diphosphohydrolase